MRTGCGARYHVTRWAAARDSQWNWQADEEEGGRRRGSAHRPFAAHCPARCEMRRRSTVTGHHQNDKVEAPCGTNPPIACGRGDEASSGR